MAIETVSNEFYLRSSSVLEFSIAYYPVCDYAACNNVLDFQTLKIALSIANIVFSLLKTIFLTVGMHFLRFLRIWNQDRRVYPLSLYEPSQSVSSLT